MGKSEADEQFEFYYVIIFLCVFDTLVTWREKVNFLKILNLLRFRKILPRFLVSL